MILRTLMIRRKTRDEIPGKDSYFHLWLTHDTCGNALRDGMRFRVSLSILAGLWAAQGKGRTGKGLALLAAPGYLSLFLSRRITPSQPET
jgi:hypothetical protein